MRAPGDGSLEDSGRRLVIALPGASVGQRLDRTLAGLIAGVSRSTVQRLIEAGAVRVDGQVVRRPATILAEAGSAEVDLDLQGAGEAAGERAGSESRPRDWTDLPIVFADLHLIVADKPAGMLTHGAAPGRPERRETSAADLAVRRFGALPSLYGEERPGVVHRLDRDTSGLLLLGRTPGMLSALKAAFQAREIEKTYLAIVCGEPRFDTEWIEERLGRHRSRRDRMSVVGEGEGRDAVTYYEVRERFDGFALLAAFPKTGRTHQVRVHLAAAGLPLLGEKLYAARGAQRAPGRAPPIARHALHATTLAFRHPESGQPVRFESEPPLDMQAALAWLRGAAGPAPD